MCSTSNNNSTHNTIVYCLEFSHYISLALHSRRCSGMLYSLCVVHNVNDTRVELLRFSLMCWNTHTHTQHGIGQQGGYLHKVYFVNFQFVTNKLKQTISESSFALFPLYFVHFAQFDVHVCVRAIQKLRYINNLMVIDFLIPCECSISLSTFRS